MKAGFRPSTERGEDSVGDESARKQRDGIRGNEVFVTREEFVGFARRAHTRSEGFCPRD